MHINKLLTFLGAFAELVIATISFVMSVGPSVCPHQTTRLPLDGFWLNLKFQHFSKNSRVNSTFIKNLTSIKDTLRKY